MAQTFQVVFYAKENGAEPAREFLLGLNKKMRAKMLRTIEMLQTNGFVKKTRVTPQTEIERARRYRKNYLEEEESSRDAL